jgi:hypothetical protein
MEISRLVVESLVSEKLRERMRVCYYHHMEYLDFPGGVFFMTSLDICNASVYFDIEGAYKKLQELTHGNYPGDDISVFMADAQKHVNSMQSGYDLPIRVNC